MTTTAAGPDERLLHPDTSMDAVTLRVGDLELVSSYYAEAFAFEKLDERGRGLEVHRVLGRGSTPMLRLIHSPDLPAVDPRQAGLFHTAFLFEDQASLAATVYRAFGDDRSRFVGSSDHQVSEAFYFTDPEGNGIELYADRPREAWQKNDDGTVVMGTVYLDPGRYLQQHLTQQALEAGAALGGTVGHVHLQVGDVAQAQDFYLDAVGFEITADLPGAVFASAGGYHHHVAMNTWRSGGAGPRAASLGLGDLAVTVPSRDDLEALIARLRHRKIPFADDGRAVRLNDPWGTQVSVAVPGTTTEDLLA